MAIELRPGVHRLVFRQVGEAAAQTYLVEADVPTLIDAAPGDVAEAFLEAVRSTGTVPERLVLTADDAGVAPAVAALREAYELEVLAPAGATFDGAFEPDGRYADGDLIGPFEALAVAGRYALFDADGGLLVAGDALVGSDARGLPPGYLLPPPAVESDDPGAAERGLYALLERPFDAALVRRGEPVLHAADARLAAFLEAPLEDPAAARLEAEG